MLESNIFVFFKNLLWFVLTNFSPFSMLESNIFVLFKNWIDCDLFWQITSPFSVLQLNYYYLTKNYDLFWQHSPLCLPSLSDSSVSRLFFGAFFSLVASRSDIRDGMATGKKRRKEKRKQINFMLHLPRNPHVNIFSNLRRTRKQDLPRWRSEGICLGKTFLDRLLEQVTTVDFNRIIKIHFFYLTCRDVDTWTCSRWKSTSRKLKKMGKTYIFASKMKLVRLLFGISHTEKSDHCMYVYTS